MTTLLYAVCNDVGAAARLQAACASTLAFATGAPLASSVRVVHDPSCAVGKLPRAMVRARSGEWDSDACRWVGALTMAAAASTSDSIELLQEVATALAVAPAAAERRADAGGALGDVLLAAATPRDGLPRASLAALRCDAWLAAPACMRAYLDFLDTAAIEHEDDATAAIFFVAGGARVHVVPRILFAAYGAHADGGSDAVVSVLAPLRRHAAVTRDAPLFVTNATLSGTDPARLRRKSLLVATLHASGAVRVENVPEFSFWRPPQRAWGAAPPPRPLRLPSLSETTTLGVLAIFKNEASVLGEWLEHYRWQGVSGFILLDNGSTDDWRAVVRDAADVRVVDAPQRHAQVEHYNAALPLLHDASFTWTLVVDLDEFAYARAAGDSLLAAAREQRGDVAQVLMPWRNFGSCGLDEQPRSVRASFVRRAAAPDLSNVKALVRTTAVTALNVHGHAVAGVTLLDGGERLALNHYRTMSRAYWRTVKMTRGDVKYAKRDTERSWRVFELCDTNDVLDGELAALAPPLTRSC